MRSLPFKFNPHLARKLAKRHAIKRKGLGIPADKASQRALAVKAATEPKPRIIASGVSRWRKVKPPS